MKKNYKLHEVSRLLDVNAAELKRLIKTSNELTSAKMNLIETKKISHKDVELLRNMLMETKEELVEEEKSFKEEMNMENKEIVKDETMSLELENFKADLIKAIYSGGKRSEKLIFNLKKHIETQSLNINESHDFAIESFLKRLKMDFDELKIKMDRQNKMVEKLDKNMKKMRNSIKRMENLNELHYETSKKTLPKLVKKEAMNTSPLKWHEKLMFEFFAPWKLRGRI